MDIGIVQQFIAKLCCNLTNSLQTCSLVKQHNDNLQTCGDFSLPVQLKCWLKYLNCEEKCSIYLKNNALDPDKSTILDYSYLLQAHNDECQNGDGFCDKAGWVMQNLVSCSKSWPLVVSRCAVQLDRVQIYLDRSQTFRSVLQLILSRKLVYGHCPTKQQTFCITTDNVEEDKNKMGLSELRIDLLRNTLHNLLKATGYESTNIQGCSEQKPVIGLHLSTKSSSKIPFGCQRILCGVVINSKNHSKETDVTAEDYRRQRCEDMKMISMHKYGNAIQQESEWKNFLFQLADAAVRIDLLHVKPSHTVCLSLDARVSGTRETSNRGAAFVLYNCARVATILRQFEEKVESGYYPQLIPYDEVNFSLLSKEEEWELIFTYLLSYPNVLHMAVKDVEQGKVAPNLVCSFVMALCSCFSIYYRRIRILTEPRNQLLPVMFARLYLLQGIQQVLHNALNLLGITPVLHM
ncbi:DALR anticodon-binding domain-containing protein 3-like isoform X3 [Periplaneta americana]|uniref:DALR anticodon-binding domain-containing protein 3-like isoform X3 n=1 Tax=Periplaneta americana TaxID=6978 RepID=UPI0037E78914